MAADIKATVPDLSPTSDLNRRGANYQADGVVHDHLGYTKNQKVLIIGTSIVKHVVKHVAQDSVHVVCVPGGKVADIEGEIVKLGKEQLAEYNKIVIQAGSNDLAEKSSIEVAKEMEQLVMCMRGMMVDPLQVETVLSGVTPRMGSGDYSKKMKALNSTLDALGQQHGLTFVNNTDQFMLMSGEIDDSVYTDNVHLDSGKGTLRLIQGWGVPLRDPRAGHRSMMVLQNTVKAKPTQPWLSIEKVIQAVPAELRGEIAQAEKRNSGVWLITMGTVGAYDKLKEQGLLFDNGIVTKCYDVGERVEPTREVTLSDVPYQVTDELIRSLLSGYGTVQNISRQRYEGTAVLNGKVKVDMTILVNMPKSLHIASNVEIAVVYAGQRVECANCGSLAHFTSKCAKPRPCYICRQDTHKAVDCPRVKSCFKCGIKGHLARSCRGVEEGNGMATNTREGQRQGNPMSSDGKNNGTNSGTTANSRESQRQKSPTGRQPTQPTTNKTEVGGGVSSSEEDEDEEESSPERHTSNASWTENMDDEGNGGKKRPLEDTRDGSFSVGDTSTSTPKKGKNNKKKKSGRR